MKNKNNLDEFATPGGGEGDEPDSGDKKDIGALLSKRLFFFTNVF